MSLGHIDDGTCHALLKARIHFVCVDFEQPADVRETIKALALHSLKISVTDICAMKSIPF